MITVQRKKSTYCGKDADSLYVSFKYREDFVRMIKTLPIRFYLPSTKEWEIPVDSLEKLRAIFRDIPISIEESKKEEKQQQVLKDQKAEEENRKLLQDVVFKTTPYKHQVDGVAYGLKHPQWLLADEQGLGKTKQAIDIATTLRSRGEIKHALIVCGVNGLKFNWVEQIAIHSDCQSLILGSRKKKDGTIAQGSMQDKIDDLKSIPKDAFFLITNIESLRNISFVKYLETSIKYGEIGMCIFDEIQHMRNPTSMQGRHLKSIKTKYKLAMTGTPVMNKPIDLYNGLHWLGAETCSFTQFRHRYCIFGGFGGYEVIGYRNLPELRDKVDSIMLRRLKKDVLDLPDKTRMVEYVEMTENQAKLYKDVRAQIIDNLDNISLHPNPLSQLIRLRQVTGAPEIISAKITESAKLDRMEELVDELIENGKKVVIFTNWVDVLFAINNRLTKKCQVFNIFGEVKPETRQAIINNFQEFGHPCVLAGTTGSMGTGITLTAADTAIFVDIPWTASSLEQAEDRLHRIGQKSAVTSILLTTKNTIDERVLDIVAEKKQLSNILVEGTQDVISNKDLLRYLLS